MNSWHSFSPNGRWLVFSSKSRSPYTQMFLTHLDAEGNDSPAILIENSTAANRAVNIPEFVNIPPSGMMKIGVPAAVEEAIVAWKKVLQLDPGNAKAHNNLGEALMWKGDLAEGTVYLQKARELDPNFNEAQSDFGIGFYNREQFRAAVQNSDCVGTASYGNKILVVAPDDSEVKKAVADCVLQQVRKEMRAALEKSDWLTALSSANKVLAMKPDDVEARRAVRECNLAITRPR
jgi:tetratricopeptide (TPR) repeat protein